MVDISGKTANGYTYDGIYQNAGPNRVTWTATYRRNGIFFGMRHGRVDGLHDLPPTEIDEVVRDDISQTWAG